MGKCTAMVECFSYFDRRNLLAAHGLLEVLDQPSLIRPNNLIRIAVINP